MKERTPYPLTTQCACMDDEGYIWMVSNMVNGLFRLDVDAGKAEYITSFEKEPMFCGSLYTKAFWYKGKMICIPCYASNIAIYEARAGEIRYIPIRNEDYLVYFNAVLFTEEKVLLFPVIYSHFAYILNLDTETYETIPLENSEYDSKAKDMIVHGEALCGEKAYFVIQETDLLFTFDLKTHVIEFFHGENQYQFITIASDGKYLYPLHVDGRGYDVYDRNLYVTTRWLFPEHEKGSISYEHLEYIVCDCVDDVVVNVPMRRGSLQVFQNGHMENIPLNWERISMVDAKIQAFHICIQRKEKLLVLPYHSCTVLEIALSAPHVRYFDISIDQSVLNQCYKKFWEKSEYKTILNESVCPLQRYLSAVEDMAPKGENEIEKQTNGSKLYDTLCARQS